MTDFLMAEAGIRQLHSRYIDSVYRKDFAAFGDCLGAFGDRIDDR